MRGGTAESVSDSIESCPNGEIRETHGGSRVKDEVSACDVQVGKGPAASPLLSGGSFIGGSVFLRAGCGIGVAMPTV